MTDTFPHAPDNAERDRLDGGFSAGWGRHFLPAEEHVIDCHLRYLKALRLPQDALDKVCWQNARRVFGLAEPEGWFTATTRP